MGGRSGSPIRNHTCERRSDAADQLTLELGHGDRRVGGTWTLEPFGPRLHDECGARSRRLTHCLEGLVLRGFVPSLRIFDGRELKDNAGVHGAIFQRGAAPLPSSFSATCAYISETALRGMSVTRLSHDPCVTGQRFTTSTMVLSPSSSVE